MNNPQSPDKSVVERRVGLALACFVVITFVVFIFVKPEVDSATLAIIRFLAAIVGALSAYLYLGNIDIAGTIPFSKIQVRAGGAFAVFIIILVLFFYGIDTSNLSEHRDDQVSLRHLTAFNEYPTLAIAEIDIPKVFLDSINVVNNPIIYTNNEIYKNIEAFKRETGSQNIFSERYASTPTTIINYALNQDGTTIRSSSFRQAESFRQTKADFETDTVDYEGKAQEFNYAPIYAPFQDSLGNAKWTIIGELKSYPDINFPVGLMVQYPNFGDIDKRFLVSDRSSDEWIRNIIKHNPDVRGFLGFIYRYTLQYDESFNYGSCTIDLIDVTPASPYVRILDIENISDSPINLESISYRNFEKQEYKITKLQDRKEIFNNLPIQRQLVKIVIPPRQHLFIPIEFGFDSKAHDQALRRLQEISDPRFLLDKNVYIFSPGNQASDPNNPNQGTPLVAQLFTLSSNFLSQLQTKSDLLSSIPKRFIIGTAIDVTSLEIDGEKIAVSPPENEPSSYYTVSFGYGSCPYLLIYDLEKKYWIDLGNVLSDRKDARLKATESYEINRNISKVKIEEREDETSFIDSVSIIYSDVEDIKKEVFLPISSLSKVDNEYYILHKGEYLEFDFSNLIPESAKALEVKVNGYYELL